MGLLLIGVLGLVVLLGRIGLLHLIWHKFHYPAHLFANYATARQSCDGPLTAAVGRPPSTTNS